MALVALLSGGAIVGLAPVLADSGTTSTTLPSTTTPSAPSATAAASGPATFVGTTPPPPATALPPETELGGIGNGRVTINSALGLGALSVTSWTVNTSGFPGAISISGGTSPYIVFAQTGLPPGLTAVLSGSNVAFTGTPTLAGVFSSGSVTVHDNAGGSATQTFSITINSASASAPAITSAPSTTFSVGQPGNFTVTASGSPTPSISDGPPLPPGVTFTDNGNGTATLAGTPAPGSAGTYLFTITAQNSVSSVTQSFILTVNPAPAATAIVLTPRFTG
jgi:hypothetical protein